MMIIALVLVSTITANAQSTEKKVTKTAHIEFFSHTSAEDIYANNYSVVSSITPSTGAVVFSAPMQSFKFKKAMMQKHFNSPDYLDTKQFPKAKFKGEITNLSSVDFEKDGTYSVTFEGELTIHGITKTVKETGTIKVSGSTYTLDLKMKVAIADYEIALKDGKPSTNVAKVIDLTIEAEY